MPVETTPIESVIASYVAAWSEPDAAARQHLLAAIWHEQGVYTDPVSHAAGRDALNDLIAGFLAGNPGATFVLEGDIDHHHHHIRFFWRVRLTDNREMSGMDYGEVADDGRLMKIVGFFQT